MSSEQEFVISEWVNEEFFVKALEHIENSGVVVSRFEVKPGASKGDNFASNLVRAKVTYRLKESGEVTEVSLILKNKSEDPFVSEIVKEFNVFEREKCVYKNILTESCLLLNSFGDCSPLGPRLLYDDENTIVLEDLAVNGYKLANRKLRLNLVHSKVLIRKLAKFHAATAVLSQKNFNIFKYNLEGNIGDADNPFQLFYQNSIDECIKVADGNSSLKKYVDFLRSFGKNVIEREGNIFSRDENAFNVLNHGDLWINNLLWKYDNDGNIEDVLMVDHQEGYFGSPGIDLNHFLFTSCNTEVQENHLEDLVKLYHEELETILQKLKYDAKIPSLDDIKNEMKLKADHAILIALSIIPVMIIENSEYATAENFISDSEDAKQIRQEVFNNSKFIEILTNVMPKLIALMSGNA